MDNISINEFKNLMKTRESIMINQLFSLTARTPITRPNGKYSPETGEGDFHCWIEDNNGNVIYDPEYEFDRVMVRLYGGEKVIKKYKAFEKIEQINVMKVMKILHREKNEMFKKIFADRFNEWESIQGECFMNCWMWLKNNKGGKMVIGSMGYLLNDGRIHWEYG